MDVRIKKLDPKAVIPKYAKSGDAGLDLVAVNMNRFEKYVEYGTGLAIEIPEGYVGLIFPRSSVTNTGLMLKNSVGVIDSGYRGEIKFRFQMVDFSNQFAIYNVGDKIGQMIILPYPQIFLVESDVLKESERGEGGYGSTGK